MKYNFAVLAVFTMGATSVHAGGMEVTKLPTAMMFEKGTHASLSYGTFRPDVTDDTYATKGTMYKDRSAITATFKTKINDKVSLGFASYKSAEIQLDYTPATNFFTTVSPYVDLSIETMALLGRYEVSESL